MCFRRVPNEIFTPADIDEVQARTNASPKHFKGLQAPDFLNFDFICALELAKDNHDSWKCDRLGLHTSILRRCARNFATMIHVSYYSTVISVVFADVTAPGVV